jgi:hypothetical protein
MHEAAMNARLDDYDQVMEIMVEAMEKIDVAQISREGLLRPLSDFVTAIAIKTAGEDGVRALMARMEQRIEDWKSGKFPKDDPKQNPPVPPLGKSKRRK